MLFKMSNNDDWFKQYKTYEAKVIELNKTQEGLAKKIKVLEKQVAFEELLTK